MCENEVKVEGEAVETVFEDIVLTCKDCGQESISSKIDARIHIDKNPNLPIISNGFAEKLIYAAAILFKFHFSVASFQVLVSRLQVPLSL